MFGIPFVLFSHSAFSSPERGAKVSYCDRPMSVVRRASSVIRRAASKFALKAYSSYTTGPIDSKLGRKY